MFDKDWPVNSDISVHLELAWCIFFPHGLVYVLQSWPGVLLHVLQSWPGVCVTELAWCTCYRAGLVYVLQNWPGVCVTELAWCMCYRAGLVHCLPRPWGRGKGGAVCPAVCGHEQWRCCHLENLPASYGTVSTKKSRLLSVPSEHEPDTEKHQYSALHNNLLC